jgi:hypothetical protein
MKIWAYGDSFVAGDQDIPGQNNADENVLEHNRYNVSFASVLAKHIGVELINRAIPGCSNFVQLDRFWMDASNISPDDLVIFGLTTAWRDRFQIPWQAPGYLAEFKGDGLVYKPLLYNEDDRNRVSVADLFYVLSTVEQLAKVYNLNVVKFNLFHNCLQEASKEDNDKFKFDKFIGQGIQGNTLIDMLTDNWGSNISRMSDHSKWDPDNNYKHLFTAKSHPNVDGHKLIAKWLYKELKKNNWVSWK